MFFSKKSKEFPKLQAGDVIFFEPADFVGKVIQLITFSKYSHVALVIDANRIIEAETSGVRIVPISEALGRTQNKDAYILKPEARARFNEAGLNSFVTDVNGRPYDFYQAFMSGLHGIDRKISNKESEKKFFCSELAADGLYHSNVLPDINSSNEDPGNLYRRLVKLNII